MQLYFEPRVKRVFALFNIAESSYQYGHSLSSRDFVLKSGLFRLRIELCPTDNQHTT